MAVTISKHFPAPDIDKVLIISFYYLLFQILPHNHAVLYTGEEGTMVGEAGTQTDVENNSPIQTLHHTFVYVRLCGVCAYNACTYIECSYDHAIWPLD